MKKFLVLLFVLSLNNQVFSAGGDGGSSSSGSSATSLYDQAVKLIKRAGTYEKKDKGEWARTDTTDFVKSCLL